MKSFDVLDPSVDIHRHHLLEASAGTGKTFSIENIIVRLLIEEKEGQPLPTLEQILTMTFTKAAANELKQRVRATLEKAIRQLEDDAEDATLPYLIPFLDDETAALNAKKALERALFCFDDANIFTLHGFCMRMLKDNVFEGGISIDAIGGEEQVSKTALKRIIKDFLSIGLSKDKYSHEQVAILLNNDSDAFENALLKLAMQGKEILPRPSFSALYDRFRSAMRSLKEEDGFDSVKLNKDIASLLPCYKKVNEEICRQLDQFSTLFDDSDWDEDVFNTLIREGLPITTVFSENNQKKKTLLPQLHYPQLVEVLKEKLEPIVNEARHPAALLARMGHDCRAMIFDRLNEEELLTFDEILKAMDRALDNEAFNTLVSSRYRAAIIDEFQDTDPIQWSLFKKLFLKKEWKGILYLVGDPKQSIYAFRDADIYTYLNAAAAVGEENSATLDINRRSTASLVHAINLLFSEEHAPGVIALPKLGRALPFHPARAADTASESPYEDSLGALHFFVAQGKLERRSAKPPLEAMEKQFFLPYISDEIIRLHKEEGVALQRFAILVADRFQGQRVQQHLNVMNIPNIVQKSDSLADDLLLKRFREVIDAAINPNDDSVVKIALGGPLIGWDDTAIFSLADHTIHEKILIQLHRLRRLLFEEGFAQFFHAFLNSRWHEDAMTVMERLLSRKQGSEQLTTLLQIAELIMDEQCAADALPAFFDSFEMMKEDEDKRLNIKTDPFCEAVKIVTIHSSKGLEYDIVFALGAVKRSKEPEKIVPVDKEGTTVLDVVFDTDALPYRRYCEESDAEKIRQLYVAMTRAKFRLYLPLLFADNCSLTPGTASPVELLMARLAQPETKDYKELYQRIDEAPDFAYRNFLTTQDAFTTVLLNDHPPQGAALAATVSPPLSPPQEISIPGEPLFLVSFTSLSKQIAAYVHDENKLSPPHDFAAPEKTAHSLPSSNETGILLHSILEEIPFNVSDIDSFVAPYTAGTPYEPWTAPISAIIKNALQVDIDGFSLQEIDNNACFRETEFLYPSEAAFSFVESTIPDGLMKGVIDLLFYHQGKYYILDWKSNWLGPTAEDYHQDNLQTSMHEHKYTLQAALYKEAVRRYLHLVDRRPFEEIYGGAFYLFLRGLDVDGIVRLR